MEYQYFSRNRASAISYPESAFFPATNPLFIPSSGQNAKMPTRSSSGLLFVHYIVLLELQDLDFLDRSKTPRIDRRLDWH